jgi:hypothetical protein
MNLKRIFLLALMATSSLVFAAVDMRTTVRDVYIDGSCEQAGSIEFVMNADDFQNASTSEPVYIRITFDKGAKLCKTLVWHADENATDLTYDPIYLPIAFENSDANTTVTAPARAISIVRWKEGENQIWLRIQSASSTWVGLGAGTQAPDNDNRLRWGIGFSASTYWSQNFNKFNSDDANLPSTTRFDGDDAALTADDVTQDDAVSTLLCVDLTSSNLEASPFNPETQTILNFNLISFDDSTFGVFEDDDTQTVANAGQIQIGQIIQPSFSADNPVAKGLNQTCQSALPKGANSRGSNALCLDSSTSQQGTSENGLVCFSASLAVDISCSNSWGFHVGSVVTLGTESDSEYGFQVELDDDGDTIDGPVNNTVLLTSGSFYLSDAGVNSAGGRWSGTAFASANGTFLTPGGQVLSGDATTIYTGPNTLGGIRLYLITEVCMWYEEDPTDVLLDVAIFASNRDPADVFDAAPFDGVDQVRRCDPSLQLAYEGVWNAGSFTECFSESCTRIFFQYVPKFRNDDGTATDFYTGLSYVNHGVADLNEVNAWVYEADGSLWTVSLPELPVREQNTWLIEYDEAQGGVVFKNRRGDADQSEVRVPTSDTDLVFGNLRSSMFVVGCANSEDQASNSLAVDLDGYLLIGAGEFISGAYAARNFEVSGFGFSRARGQDGDLPILTNKRGTNFNKVDRDVVNQAARSFVK